MSYYCELTIAKTINPNSHKVTIVTHFLLYSLYTLLHELKSCNYAYHTRGHMERNRVLKKSCFKGSVYRAFNSN